MRYLFGDSSESNLEINYLAFLRDAVEFGVAVLGADAGIAALRDKRVVRERAADEAARSVEEFGRAATMLTEPLVKGEAPINRTAAAIAQATVEAVKREVGRVRATLTAELEQIDGETRAQRERCSIALQRLIATHDLPGASETMSVRWAGTAFGARLRQKASFGVEATIGVDVPAASLFAHELRVERVGDGIEVHAPESAGWLKKEVKMVPHRLGRHFVTEVIVAPPGVTVRVRATHDAGAAGFDVMVAKNGDVKVERAGNGDAGGEGFATDERDLPILRAFAGKLEEAARALRAGRGALVDASIDGKALATHEHPRLLVERLVEAMTPVVAEIARHCLSPRELVLKRLLGGDRREEIFLARAELTQKLEPLPEALRRVFAPLGIVDEASHVPVAVAAVASAPVAAAAPPARAPSPEVVTSAIDPHRAVTVPAPEPQAAVASVIVAPPPPKSPPKGDSQPSIVIEAEAPPAREATLPPLSPSPRGVRKTAPPSPPPAARSDEATAAAVDAALRDLDDGEPTQVVTSPPRPPRADPT